MIFTSGYINSIYKLAKTKKKYVIKKDTIKYQNYFIQKEIFFTYI